MMWVQQVLVTVGGRGGVASEKKHIAPVCVCCHGPGNFARNATVSAQVPRSLPNPGSRKALVAWALATVAGAKLPLLWPPLYRHPRLLPGLGSGWERLSLRCLRSGKIVLATAVTA